MGFILQGPSLLDNPNNLLQDVFDLARCRQLALWVIPGVSQGVLQCIRNGALIKGFGHCSGVLITIVGFYHCSGVVE